MADMNLLEFLRSLIWNDEAREDFADNPDKALDDAGLGHLSGDDVHDALVLMQEDNQDASFDRNYDTGGNEINVAAPEPVNHDDDGGSESAVEYINRYITNNYTDDRDTITDNSTNQQIDTGGGDFDQDIDVDSTVASGDGAVAAGDDIEDSEIVSGNGNTVGDGNIDGDGNVTGDGNDVVNGDGNTSSFGDGDATSTEIDGDVSVGDGGSFAVGGDSEVDNSDNSEDNSVEDSFNDNSENSVDDSFNDSTETTENSDYDIDDSYNSSNESTEDSNNEVDHNHEVEIQA